MASPALQMMLVKAVAACCGYEVERKRVGGIVRPRREFDDRLISWHPLEGFENIAYHVYDVDEKNGIVDVLFKFAAHGTIGLHRHKAPYRTLVLQGELRIYRANGELKEVRPTGSYITSSSDSEPHTEGAGNVDAIVFFSNRNVGDVIYEILDEDLKVIASFGPREFQALRDVQ